MTDFFGFLILFALTFGFTFAAIRSSYKNGVADGFDACKRPDDLLWNVNGVNKILRSTGRGFGQRYGKSKAAFGRFA